jgi:hypothetical protein
VDRESHGRTRDSGPKCSATACSPDAEISTTIPITHKRMVSRSAKSPDTGRVTFVLLRTGHLWSHRAVLVPRSAVAEVGADGFHVDITVQQMRDLPPADIGHLAG